MPPSPAVRPQVSSSPTTRTRSRRRYKKFHATPGRREDEALDFLAELHEAREKGDKRVMFDQERYTKEAAKQGERMRTRGAGAVMTL